MFETWEQSNSENTQNPQRLDNFDFEASKTLQIKPWQRFALWNPNFETRRLINFHTTSPRYLCVKSPVEQTRRIKEQFAAFVYNNFASYIKTNAESWFCF